MPSWKRTDRNHTRVVGGLSECAIAINKRKLNWVELMLVIAGKFRLVYNIHQYRKFVAYRLGQQFHTNHHIICRMNNS